MLIKYCRIKIKRSYTIHVVSIWKMKLMKRKILTLIKELKSKSIIKHLKVKVIMNSSFKNSISSSKARKNILE